MRENKIFWHILTPQRITLYQVRYKIRSLDTIKFLDTHVCINNPHWQQSSGIIIFLSKYFIVTSNTIVSSFMDVLFLLLAVILSELDEKPRRIELQKKVHRKICVWDTTFVTPRPPFYIIFCCFLCLIPPPSKVIYLLNGPSKDIQYCCGWYSVWWYQRSKIQQSLAI